MKIVVLDADTVSIGDIEFQRLKELGDVEIYGYTESSDIISHIGNADAIFCNKSPITKNVINSCQNLKYIGLFSTGFNNVDLKVASDRNIVVTNVPQYSNNAVNRHVLACILDNFSMINEYAKSVDNCYWVNSKLFSYFPFPTQEIANLTLGIIGFGSIGKKIAEVATAFEMKVISFTRTVPQGYDNVKFVSLNELLAESDVVSLHCPLNKQTQGMVCSDFLEKMKKTSVLINAARGPLVNEADLAQALKNKTISKAYLDVIDVEPMLQNNPLRNIKNCFITPHVAWAPQKTRQRLVDKVVDNFIAFENANPQNVVNKGSV